MLKELLMVVQGGLTIIKAGVVLKGGVILKWGVILMWRDTRLRSIG